MNLEKITSGEELVSLFPDKFNSNMDEIDAAVGDNTSDISALDGRMTTAEGNIQTNADDIAAINTSLTTTLIPYTFTAGANVNLRGTSVVYRSGKTIHIGVYFDTTAQLSNNATICTVSGNLPKPVTAYVTAAVHGIASTEGMTQIERGDLTKIKTWGVLPAATYYYAQFCYLEE